MPGLAVLLGGFLSTAGLLLLASLDLRQQLVDQERLLGDQASQLAHLTDCSQEIIIYYSLIDYCRTIISIHVVCSCNRADLSVIIDDSPRLSRDCSVLSSLLERMLISRPELGFFSSSGPLSVI